MSGAYGATMRLSSTLLLLTAITFAACAGKNPPPTVASAAIPTSSKAQASDSGLQLSTDEIARQLFVAVNKQRTDNGLQPLAMAPELMTSAQEHSDKMASGPFLSTKGADEPSAISRITNQGVKTLKLGEDVVRLNAAPARVADATTSIWMGAAADRKNVLSTAFTKTGIGVTRAADGDYYISADFAQ